MRRLARFLGPLDVERTVGRNEIGRTLVGLFPGFVDHSCRYVAEVSGIERRPILAAVVLHDEGAAENGDCLVRGMPVPGHVVVLRGPEKSSVSFAS